MNFCPGKPGLFLTLIPDILKKKIGRFYTISLFRPKSWFSLNFNNNFLY